MHILIVDDHPLFRQGLRMLLMSLDAESVVTDVATVADALLAGQAAALDLVLLDMNMPGTRGVEGLRQIKAACENAAVVVISGDESLDTIHASIEAGAAGYIPKTTDAELTIQALRVVLAKGIYLPRCALQRPSASDGRSTDVTTRAAHPEFSARQHAALKCLLQGKSNKVIARELNIAEGTVKAHLWAIYQALGVNSRTQAMYKVHELKLFDGPAQR